MQTIRNDSPDTLTCISYLWYGQNKTVPPGGTLSIPDDLVTGYTDSGGGGWTLV